VAKWAGVWVHEFAIGFGPAAFRKKKGETEYTFRVLPLGGFVRMAGEESDTEEDQTVPPDRLFSAKSPWARMAIIFAGPLFNIVFAILMIIAYVGIFGTPYIEVVEANPVAPSYAVFESGDKIVELDGQEIYFGEQIQSIIQSVGATEIDAVLLRGDQEINTRVLPYYDDSVGRFLIGVYFNYPLSSIRTIPNESGAATEGILRSGDHIFAVNGQPTINWHQLTDALHTAVDEGGEITIMRQRGEDAPESVAFDSGLLTHEQIDNMDAILNGALPPTTNVISRVNEESMLYDAGLRVGDRVLAANGQPVYSAISLVEGIYYSIGAQQPLEILYERDGSQSTLIVDLQDEYIPSEIIGTLSFDIAQRSPANIFASAWIGVKQIGNIMVNLWLGIKAIFTGEVDAAEAFRGPVGIANILGWSLTQGFDRFFQLVALLSLVLGVFNLVPFPALDGSRIVFIFYELIRGKPFPPEKEGWVHYIGFILLMGLIVLITWQDIQRIITGGGL